MKKLFFLFRHCKEITYTFWLVLLSPSHSLAHPRLCGAAVCVVKSLNSYRYSPHLRLEKKQNYFANCATAKAMATTRSVHFISLQCLILFSVIASCKKDKKIEISTTPSIEFVSITPSTAIEYQDKITITISYKDGDGDLGENTPDVKNLFLTDTRNNVTYQYRISQLAPSGQATAIQGTLTIELKNTAITNGAVSQAVSFSVYLKDRTGNISNTVSTSSIIVTN